MLEGIEVLNQTEIIEAPEWAATILAISIFLTIGLFIIENLIESNIGNAIILILEFVCIITTIVFIVINITVSVPTGKYEYKVTIDDSVSMTKFHEKYEIIDVEGKIYTIREKE